MLLLCYALQIAIFILKSGLVNSSNVQTGPIFIKEPNIKLNFMNTVGARLDCLAYGKPAPKITWFQLNDQKSRVRVQDIQNVIQVLENGTLIFQKFSSDEFNPSVHANTYVCQASNVHGRIVSANINVRAATEEQQQQVQAQVYDTYAMPGNTAVFKCHIPTFLSGDLEVVAWVREDNFVIKPENPSESYGITNQGNLHIQSVSRKMNLKLGYWCQVENSISGKIFLSQTAGRIIITVPQGGVRPTITDLPKRIYVDKESSFVVNCAAQGYPSPEIVWTGNTSLEILSKKSKFRVTNANLRRTNVYHCTAQNRYGKDRRSVEIVVKEKLHAVTRPSVIKVDNYKDAEFECIYEGYPVEKMKWIFNGLEVANSSKLQIFEKRLRISSVGREQEGMYQCFISNKWGSSQSTAQLILESVTPQFIRTFDAKVIQPGPSISLKCIADGRPKPTILWKFNGQIIESNQRFNLEENDLPTSTVESVLTVKNIRTRDGGTYTCIAENNHDSVEYSNKISVYGLPYIHSLPNITVPSGEDTFIECYVSGFPINSITWEKVGSSIVIQRNLKDFQNGTLMIRKMDKGRDEGDYACVVDNGRGQFVRKTFHLNGLAKPIIKGPVETMEEVKAGESFTTLCNIVSGDGTIKMYWMKNDQRAILGKGIDISTTKKYSLLQIREVEEKDAGNYSCVAENSIGKDKKVVVLNVLSSPKWNLKPKNVNSTVGQNVMLDCQGSGHPNPKTEWYRMIGKQASKIGYKDINGRSQVKANGSLYIPNIDLSAAGNYSCIVSNGISPDLFFQTYIQVLNAVNIVFFNESVAKPIGVQVTLMCKVSGIGIDGLTWTLNNKLLKNSSEWGVNMYIVEDVVVSTLSFNFIGKDAGQYKCNAKNNNGAIHKSMNLTVFDMNRIHSKKTVSGLVTTTAIYHPSQTEQTTMVQFHLEDEPNSTNLYMNDEKNKKISNMEEVENQKGNILESKNMLDEEIDFKAVMFIVPTAAVIVLLIAVIVTLILFLIARKNHRPNINPGNPDYEMGRTDTLGRSKTKTGTQSSTIERRYGKLEPPYPPTRNKRESIESNAYEIPDYYATSKPYATLSTRKGSNGVNHLSDQNQSSL